LIPILSAPVATGTGDGATVSCTSELAAGTIYYYSKDTPFTGARVQIRDEIISKGLSAPASFNPSDTLTGQSSETPYYLGWVQKLT
jgi:hypothetical protein